MSVTKRARFVVEYLGSADGNATQAAISAGYSVKTARQCASRLLTRADVQDSITAHRKRLEQRLGVTAERVIRELSLIAFADPRALFDQAGQLRNVADLPEDVARALSSVEVRTITHKDEPDVTIAKVKSWDKPRALDMLGRYLALWNDKRDNTGKVTVNIGFLQTAPELLPTVTMQHHESTPESALQPHAVLLDSPP